MKKDKIKKIIALALAIALCISIPVFAKEPVPEVDNTVESLLKAGEKDYNYAYFTYNYENYVLKKSEFAQFEHDLKAFATLDEFYYPSLVIDVNSVAKATHPTDFSSYTEYIVDPRAFWAEETWTAYYDFETAFETKHTEYQWQQIEAGIYRHEIWLDWKGLYSIDTKKMRDNSNVFLRSPEGTFYAVAPDGTIDFDKAVPTWTDNYVISTQPATGYSAGADTGTAESQSEIPEQVEIPEEVQYRTDYFKIDIFKEIDKLTRNTVTYVVEGADTAQLEALLANYRQNIRADLNSVDFKNPNIYPEDAYYFDYKLVKNSSSSRGSAVSATDAKEAIIYLNQNRVSSAESDGTAVRVTYSKNGNKKSTIYYLTDSSVLLKLFSYNIGSIKTVAQPTGYDVESVEYQEWIHTPALEE